MLAQVRRAVVEATWPKEAHRQSAATLHGERKGNIVRKIRRGPEQLTKGSGARA